PSCDLDAVRIVAMVVLGGMGHVPGVILGAILLYAIPEALRIVAKPSQIFLFGEELIPTEALRMLLFGGSMVVIMLIRPKGLWPPPRHGERAPLPGQADDDGGSGGDGGGLPGGGGTGGLPVGRLQGGTPGPLAPGRG